jgi:lipopolysaccharide biosynthesis protein
LYVSTPLEQHAEVAVLVRNLGWQRAEIVGVENQGRDVAPFLLELLPRALMNGHPWLLKLHTKRSSHLDEGDRWSQHLRRTLETAANCCLIDEWFAQDADLALIAPPGSLLPCTLSLHQNAEHLLALLPRLEQSGAWFLQQSFVAGSMFAARCQALAPLTALNLRVDDFEPECDQSDGTLAHALERLVAPVVIHAGLKVRELPGKPDSTPRFGHGWAAPLS